jgi:amidohydrolase
MRPLVPLLLLAACLAPSAKAQTDEAVLAIEPRVIEWRRDFHRNPELSNREFRTAGIVAEHLRGLGLEVTTGVAHTGVVGVLRGGRPGPVVALRADMDALPVPERNELPFRSTAVGEYRGEEVPVMHACGHDTHVAMLMAVAEILSGMRDELPGTVKFIFQPAEEGAPPGERGGAEVMVEEGVLEDPRVDAVFGLHIDAQREVGTIGYRPRGAMASVQDFRITVHGRQAHGSTPWHGVDPIVTAAQIVGSLQTVVSRSTELTRAAAVVTVGAIHGGVRSNIIPEEVEMVGTIRTFEDDMRDRVHRRIREIAEHTAAANGATVTVEIPMSASYPVTFNDPDLTAAMLPSLVRAAGEGNVELVDAETGAEDFSFFANEVPGFYFNVGGMPRGMSRDEAPSHHTPDFFIDESGMRLGVQAMLNVAIDYLNGAAQ